MGYDIKKRNVQKIREFLDIKNVKAEIRMERLEDGDGITQKVEKNKNSNNTSAQNLQWLVTILCKPSWCEIRVLMLLYEYHEVLRAHISCRTFECDTCTYAVVVSWLVQF